MVSNRIGSDGSYNIVVGADVLFNYAGNHYLDLKTATTFDSRVAPDFIEQTLFRVNFLKRRSRGFYYDISALRSGQYYLPETGFNLSFNYSQFDLELAYGYFSRAESKTRIINPSLKGTLILRNKDRSVETFQLE